MGRFDSTYEPWDTHRARIEAERKRAADENLCAEVVNDWAGSGDTRRKICLRKKSPEAVQLGYEQCGMHFRQQRKLDAEADARRAEHERQKIENERRDRVQKVKDAQEAAIEQLLAQRGLTDAQLSRPWRFNKAKLGWTVTVPLSVVWKLIDELPMLDPDEAAKVFEENERLAAEAAKPTGTEAPF